MGTEGILTQRFAGKTFLELSQEDPIAATQALYEANQRALTQFAGETAKELLKSEKPEVDTGLIEKQAQKLEEKPTPEDLTKLQEAATRTTGEFTQAQTVLNDLNSPVETAENALAEKQLAFDEAKEIDTNKSTVLLSQIEKLETDADQLSQIILQKPDPSMSAEEKTAFQQSVAIAAQMRNETRERIKDYNDQLAQIRSDLARARRELETATRNKSRIEQDAKDKGLDEAKENLRLKKAAKEEAENGLKEKQQNALEEVSPDAKEKAKAFREWAKVATGYDGIINARLSQTHGDEYTRERLADIKERPDGQIEGVERIREHIFRLVNKDGYDPQLARKMLSDETIARAIIWTYKLDPEVISTKGNTLNQLLSDLNKTKDMIRESPKDIDLLREKTDQEKEIVKLALPYLRSSQFQTGDLLRFMIHEGLKSAERGNPYLQLSEYYESPKPELRLEAEAIYKEGVGAAEINIEDNTVDWTGEVTNSNLPDLANNSLPIRYRIRQQINTTSDIYSVEVFINQRLIQSLPDNIAGETALPIEIQNAFYADGKLKTTTRPSESWIMVHQGASDTTENALLSLENSISPEISKLIPAALANHILEKPPQERLKILEGLPANIDIQNIEMPHVNPDGTVINILRNYTIDFDNNGNLFITDTTDPNKPKYELEHFFQKTLEDFTKSIGVQSLNPKQRETLNNPFLQIQNGFGREILKALQRR